MSEDVIEFGSDAGRPERPTRRTFRIRSAPPGSALPLAGAGVAAGVASFIGPWQTTSLPLGSAEGDVREVGSALAAVGPAGGAYMVVLVLLVTTVTIVLFGRSDHRSLARLVGLALAGGGLAIVASLAYSLSKTSILADFRLYPPDELNNVRFILEWGIYVAFGAVLALGGSLLVKSAQAAPAVEVLADPDEIDLSVSVHPADIDAKSRPGGRYASYRD